MQGNTASCMPASYNGVIAAFTTCFESSAATNTPTFKQFQAHWSESDKTSYQDAIIDTYTDKHDKEFNNDI